ncbi:MAG: hypothetical protein ACLRFN_00680 [Alphaproteobacteria bacterium]
MRKYFFMIFATFFAGNLWAACQPTTNQLTKKSGPYHNEYLYKDTTERETRRAGGTGEAYLCGYVDRGGCEVGERFAFEGAAVGNTDHTGLTVYTCDGGGENYYWTAVPVEEKCYSDELVNGESVGEMTLYKVGYKYCEQVVYLKDVISEIVDNAIRSNNDTLLEQFWEELNTKIGDVYNSQEFKTAVVNVVNGMDKSLSEDNLNTIIVLISKGIQDSGFAEQIGDIQSDIEGIKNRLSNIEGRVTELKDGLKNTADSLFTLAVQHKADVTEIKAEFKNVWDTLNESMSDDEIEKFVSEKITALETELMVLIKAQGGNLDNFKKDVKKIEDELRSTLNKYGIQIANLDSRITGLEGRMDVAEDNIERLREGLNQAVTKIHELAAEYGVSLIKTEAEFNKVWAELGNKMNKDDVEELVKTYIINSEQIIMQEIQNTNFDLDEFKKKVADIEKDLRDKLEKHGIEIAELETRIAVLENRVDTIEGSVKELKTDLKNTANNLLVLATKYEVKVTEIKAEFEKVWEQLNDTMTKQDIEKFVNEKIAELEDKLMSLIEAQGKDLDNFKKEVKDIEDKLKDRLDKIDIRLNGLESRITALEAAKTEIMSKLENLAVTDASLQSAIEALKADLANKVTMEQVLSTVAAELANANLNENQKNQVIAIIMQYTESLSAGQRQQVEIMIQEKIGTRFDELGAANQLQDAQRVSQDKVNSAMSVLNAFAAGQDASVWRNADGKFNTARLASDATAGVILGTAGGLISNKIIKKNQIKKGFEGIGCYVGGQVVADYGDEFTVGMM